jgi:uncharacterized membrane protein YfcA
MAALVPYGPEIIALAFGGGVSAFYGRALSVRSPVSGLSKLSGYCLRAWGVGCCSKSRARSGTRRLNQIASSRIPPWARHRSWDRTGYYSSLPGVAGGELQIPTLTFMFGADIKTAGSASILISLGVVLSGLWRYWRIGGQCRGRGV